MTVEGEGKRGGRVDAIAHPLPRGRPVTLVQGQQLLHSVRLGYLASAVEKTGTLGGLQARNINCRPVRDEETGGQIERKKTRALRSLVHRAG